MRIGLRGLALGANCMVMCFIGACASAPQLKDSILDEMGKTEVVYVTPKDDMIDTDPATTRLAHAGKFVALTYLTGGLFGIGGIGAAGYFAGNRFPGGMEDRIKNQRELWVEQDWQRRMRSAVQRAVGASKLDGATWLDLDHYPNADEMPTLAKTGGFDTLAVIAPQMQIASEGDHLRMLVNVDVISFPHSRPAAQSCRDCEYLQTEDPEGPDHDSGQLEVTQALVAVDGGKTWEEQKEAGHKLHDLTEGDFAMFWLHGNPPPLKTFMDTGLQSLQSQLTLYFGGKASVPPPLPTLKLVVNP